MARRIKKISYLSQDLHTAIAKVAIYVGILENWLESIVDLTMRHQQHTSRALLGSLTADRLVVVAMSALLDQLPDKKEEILTIEKEIKEIRHQRNEIIHWHWEPSERRGQAINAKLRLYKEPIFTYKSPADVDKIANRADEVAQRLWGLHDSIFEMMIDRRLEQRSHRKAYDTLMKSSAARRELTSRKK